MSLSAKERIGNKNPFFNKKHSIETKEKISLITKHYAKQRKDIYTKEDWKKYGSIGNANSIYGKKHNQNTKNKISMKNKGNKIKREIRVCNCGCGFKKEVKVNSIWKYKLGHNFKINPGFKNKKHTDETKLKIGLKNKGKIINQETKDKLRIIKYIELDKNIIDDIIDLYKIKKFSMMKISNIKNSSFSLIRRVLLENKVQLNKRGAKL